MQGYLLICELCLRRYELKTAYYTPLHIDTENFLTFNF